MKIIKYKILGYTGVYNAETDTVENVECLAEIEKPYTKANAEAAKREAYGGEPEIYDDGQPEPEQPMSDKERIAQLEEALELLLSGVTE